MSTSAASRLLASMILCATALGANAQGQTVVDVYSALLRTGGQTAALGPDLFGEQVNLADGTTTFYVTDVEVKTNSGLSMAVSRKLEVGARTIDRRGDNTGAESAVFGPYWELDVPFMRGTFATRTGWVTSSNGSGGWPGSEQRCDG